MNSEPASSNPQWRPTIVAHRGGSAYYPFAENSSEAFANSFGKGFLSECDVWASSDAVPIVMHDQTLDRTTSANGNVFEKTAVELRHISLNGPTGPCGTIPILADVAQYISHVEIKPPKSRDLVRRVIEVMRGRQWILQSFDAENLAEANRIDRSVKVALLVEHPEMIPIAVDRGWSVNLDFALFQDSTIGKLSDAGLTVGAWTVNDDVALGRILQYRPDSIITDLPLMIRHWMRRAGVPT